MELPKELRSLVNKSVTVLGQVIQHELGAKSYQRIEALRVGMTEIRQASFKDGFSHLQTHFKSLAALKPSEQHEVAHSFTLMLELMNACENAYRSHRLTGKKRKFITKGKLPEAIVYVLTAHPTEARSPQNIAIFHQIQNFLIQVLDSLTFDPEAEQEIDFTASERNSLLHLLEIAWRTPIVRSRSPKVKDEAEHIYSMLFRDEVLFNLIENDSRAVPFYVRTWVGGDKDGHPGVNEKTLLQSLTLSRKSLLQVMAGELQKVRKTLDLFPSDLLQKQISQVEKQLHKMRALKTGDAKAVGALKKVLSDLKNDYLKNVGVIHPQIHRMNQLLHVFPGLVVPLELREASNVLMTHQKDRKKLAIFKMLSKVEQLSRGGDPRWYARGFIISMTESIDHIRAAGSFQKAVFQSIRLPLIPLFEEAGSLAISDSIMSEMIKDPDMKKAAVEYWNGLIEMMVGYSDSAKEAGVLASRLAISEALPKLETICEKAKLTPVFFHGSGGSIDRGGGSIEDQTAWWPKSALRHYKVTIQGEMVERSLATPAIAQRQIEAIIDCATKGLQKPHQISKNPAVEKFAKNVSAKYSEAIQASEFLKLVESATPYSYLNILKIGSRPAKRTTELTVKGLRAIPWVLCWTQTRVLFPTWWGVGSSWSESNASEKADLKNSFQKDPVFTSYIKALGFTLAKIELNVWRMYLEHSGLSSEQVQKAFAEFKTECEKTLQCYQEITGHTDLMWFRPWLGESILLRSSMIHPLNLLQILAKKNKDLHLLRITVTGISSGMLTTG